MDGNDHKSGSWRVTAERSLHCSAQPRYVASARRSPHRAPDAAAGGQFFLDRGITLATQLFQLCPVQNQCGCPRTVKRFPDYSPTRLVSMSMAVAFDFRNVKSPSPNELATSAVREQS